MADTDNPYTPAIPETGNDAKDISDAKHSIKEEPLGPEDQLKAGQDVTPGVDPYDTSVKPEVARQERPMLDMTREQPDVKPPPIDNTAYLAAMKNVNGDFDAMKAAMGREKDARAGFAQDVGEAQGAAAEELRGNALESKAQAFEARQQELPVMDEIHHLVQDYGSGHIDPNQWWSEKSVPQKIGAVVGAIAAGLGGGPQQASNFVNGMIDRNIARQQEEIHRKGSAAGLTQNLLYSMMKSSGNMQEAYDKTRMAMFQAAMLEVQKAATIATSPIESAKIDEMLAAMQQQHDLIAVKANTPVAGQGVYGSKLQADPKTLYTDPRSGKSYMFEDPEGMTNFIQINDAYNRILEGLDRGQALMERRAQIPSTNVKELYDNLKEGEAIYGALMESSSKLAAGRGVPIGVKEMVQKISPDFGSLFARLDLPKIGQLRGQVEQFKVDSRAAHGARPVQVQFGPGNTKQTAGKWVPYASLGAPQESQQPQSSSAEKPKLDFQPKSE